MILGILLSVGGLYIAFREFDVSGFGAVLRGARGEWILLGVGLLVLSVWLRAVRWKILVSPIGHLGIKELFATTMIGYFGNAVLPLRLGELLRAYSLHREETSIRPAAALGTIVIERLLDVMGLVLLTVVVFFQYTVPSWLLNAGIFLGFVLAGSLVLYWWAVRSRHSLIGWLSSGSFPRGKIGSRIRYLMKSFLEGLNVLRKTGRFPLLVFHTALLWVIYAVVTHASARALGVSLTWVEIGVILVATSMVISVPSAPGYIGTYHAATVLIMVQMMNQGETESQAFAVLNHAVGFVPVVAIGFFYFLQSSMKFGEVKNLKLDNGEEDRT